VWLLGVLTVAVLTLLVSQRGVPFVGRDRIWSIGMYTGQAPLELHPAESCSNPVLTADDINDVPARYVADPFLVRDDNAWTMFFEVFNRDGWRGEIGYATSADGCQWRYGGIVLREAFHLSYPQVLTVGNDHYMIPESGADRAVRLYRATSYPERWERIATLLEGEPFRDSSVVFQDNTWWMFTAIEKSELRLYFADHLEGPWSPHPANPIIANDAGIARPGGRVTVQNGHVYRLAQDDQGSYGRQVRAFEVTELTRQSYREQLASPDPVVAAGRQPWNELGMHHVDSQTIDAKTWLAAVDGLSAQIHFGLDY